METNKYVFSFGNKKAEGNVEMKNILGGKGANLAQMNLIGIAVPPGFTITTEVCNMFQNIGSETTLEKIKEQVEAGVRKMEEVMGTSFTDPDNPLLLSVRSGARVSMPGMMDTVLNLGLNDKSAEGLIKKSGNERFVWDSYRRLIQMYGDVVLDLKAQSREDENPFEEIMQALKIERGVDNDLDLDSSDLKELVSRFKSYIKSESGKEFPSDPWTQLWGSIFAVFKSWNNDRANVYRELNDIPSEWGTAVNVQAMVYGNLNQNSATGVAFTRNAASGEDLFNGEFLVNAQGEDVVAGIRTPQQITLEGSRRWSKLARISEEKRKSSVPSLEELMPKAYEELIESETRLENYYKDMQDLEFTIQDGKLWILQTRSGKRTGKAMVKIAIDMVEQGMISERQALMRMDPSRIEDLLHPVFDKEKLNDAKVMARGLPASPGAATGQIVFFAEDAEAWKEKGSETILVRQETSPEDLRGMDVSNGILTVRGGMTSHAAVVARGMGKCCVSGAGELVVDYKTKTLRCNGTQLKEGDWISLNGNTGEVFAEKIPTIESKVDESLKRLLQMADKYARMEVRTNADNPHDAKTAKNFGAKGIGLCRTEHMFFEGDRIIAVREMILADDEEGRRNALAKLLPIQRSDFESIFKVMKGLPVTIRLLDPPLHEFLPHDRSSQEEMAKTIGVDVATIQEKIEKLNESNPMLGHRGCRLGITFPEITEMQTRAIIEAALNVKALGIYTHPEIMVPLIGRSKEFIQQKNIISQTAERVFRERSDRIEYKVGTMIEIPRAALTADLIAESAEFFSFGTNDLTQMTFGFSRDDIGKFLPLYLEEGIMDYDPFRRIDENGVGRLVNYAAKKGRKARKDLKVGICGEHGGNPESIRFFEKIKLDYVSCSPYRVPVARLVAAKARIEKK